ncbi:alcohol acetyltransferase [Brachybacterium hainanense]|uniref:Alcohol acetyltransferase n=1 Tax=Brachybacterium hainanense TaxID=1541174 RepID=A0ABV6RA47_9MICO
MSPRAWARLDNASNIFLAARSDVDPKVFRLSAEMDHEVEPEILQHALDLTIEEYPLYRAVLRRGVFWYYLLDSDLHPQVQADRLPVCAPVYQGDHRSLLFRVAHHRRRIILEVFHALSDGTGALWFLTELVTAYVRLRASDAHPVQCPSAPPASPAPHEEPESPRTLSLDSFRRHFPRRRRRDASAPGAPLGSAAAEPTVAPDAAAPDAGAAGEEQGDEAFLEAAQSAVLEDPVPPPPPGVRTARRLRAAGREQRHRAFGVHRIRGTRTPDARTRAVELTVPAAEVIARAKQARAGTTMYLTALLFEAVRRSARAPDRVASLGASVPVNLRQFYPSTSPRNFFTALRVEHTRRSPDETVAEAARALDADFRAMLEPEELDARVRRLIGLERMPLLRIVPRPLKDVLLRLANTVNNRGLTVAVSNLGRVELPLDVAPHVRRLGFLVSAARPQICVISHGGSLTITFTSPFEETGHVREFARMLTDDGIPVRIAATRVKESKLREELV